MALSDRSNDDSGKGRYMQRVTIEVEVLVNPGEGNFNEVTTDDLREGIERHVRREWLGETLARQTASITASRGPGGSRYYYPSESNVDLPFPLQVDLDNLDVPKTDLMLDGRNNR